MFVSLELDARRAMKAYRQHQAAAMVRVIQLLKEAETQEVLSLPLDIKEVKGCPHGRYGSTQPPMPENFGPIYMLQVGMGVWRPKCCPQHPGIRVE